MSERMTGERLVEIERKFHDNNRRINEDTGIPVCINPDIIELLQALKEERAEVKRLTKWAQDMVAIQAGGGKLDGYRALGQKVAAAEVRAEAAEATLKAVRKLIASKRWCGLVAIEDLDALLKEKNGE